MNEGAIRNSILSTSARSLQPRKWLPYQIDRRPSYQPALAQPNVGYSSGLAQGLSEAVAHIADRFDVVKTRTVQLAAYASDVNINRP